MTKLLLALLACTVAYASARNIVILREKRSFFDEKNLENENRNENSVTDGGNETSPRIYSLHIVSRIESRFATTLVSSKIANSQPTDAQATFVVQLPDPAFISNFSMKIDGKEIVGEVKEKEEAKQDYDAARARGESAGHVAQNLRETNTFTISVNVAKESKVVMELTYQEILKRTHGAYKHIVNVNPGQVVNDLKVDVHIHEKTEITRLLAPDFGAKVGEMTNKQLLQLPPSKHVQIKSAIRSDKSHVHFIYHPTEEQQGADGLKGQMVVLYDVKRALDAGELMVVNGYFVHFFAPEGLNVASKHVVFVLDKSGSMMGRKIEQTKEAMAVILRDLNEGDFFNIFSFSNSVHSWQNASVAVNNDTIRQAINFVNEINADGGTNINDAMVAALRHLSSTDAPQTLTPTVVFMTDGQATSGEQNSDTIIRNALEANADGETSVHSIGFGNDVDFKLLKGISLRNHGVARKVYEDSDAAIQLAGFFAEVCSPLLKNVKITYLNEAADPASLEIEQKYTAYEGGEIMLVGKLSDKAYSRQPISNGDVAATEEPMADEQTMTVNVDAEGPSGPVRLITTCILPPPCFGRWPCPPIGWPRPPTTTPAPLLAAHSVGGFVERMWAYQTIKKLLEKEKFLEKDEEKKKLLKKRALELSLKYHFVTELTSMVVIQQNNTNTSIGLEQKPQEAMMVDAYSSGLSYLMAGGGVAYKSNIYGRPGPVMDLDPAINGIPGMPGLPMPPATHAYAAHTTPHYATTAETTTPATGDGQDENRVSVTCSGVSRLNADWFAKRVSYGIDINAAFDCRQTPFVFGCRSGFVFVPDPNPAPSVDESGCRPLNNVPQDANEELVGPCAGQCEPSCDQPKPMCTRMCSRHSHAYVCKAGLLRDQLTGLCVAPDACSDDTVFFF